MNRPAYPYPETPEGVALAIMDRILDAEDRADGKRNERPRDYVLRLYTASALAPRW